MKEFFRDTRHHRRFDVESMGIRGLAAMPGGTSIIDISISGISIMTDERLHPGDRYMLKISSRDRDIYLECGVMWSMENSALGPHEDTSRHEYSAGLQFAGLSQDTMGELMKFITLHRVGKLPPLPFHQMSGRRANARFRLADAGETTLLVAEPFTVRILSLGGMLIRKSRPSPAGHASQMEMTLPPEVRVAFEGNVISCAPAEDAGGEVYEIAVKFSAMSDQNRAKLKELIRWLYLKDAGFTE